MRRVLALVAGALVLSSGLVASRAAAPCDRSCVIGIANTYLAALVSHDGSNVPLAADATRTENGGNSGASGAEIRKGLEAGIMYVITGIRELRWQVTASDDGGADAIATYFLDTVTSPTYIVERIRVRDRLIREIEAVFYIDIPGYVVGPESVLSRPGGQVTRVLDSDHGPLGPIPVPLIGGDGGSPGAPIAGCAACSATAASAYVDALVARGPGALPLAANVVRIDNRRVVAQGATAVRASVRASTARAAHNERVWGEGTHAIAIFELVDRAAGTLDVATEVTLRDGKVVRIETVCDGAERCG